VQELNRFRKEVTQAALAARGPGGAAVQAS